MREMKKSKCKYCIECVTYYEETDTFKRGCKCDIDSYDPDIGCNKHCYDYTVNNERKMEEAEDE